MNKVKFLSLGKQPRANGFLAQEDFDKEYFFDLEVQFDEYTKLVSLVNIPPKEMLFNENYVYQTSLSTPMINHFSEVADLIKAKVNKPNFKLLEIGSNDGCFLKHFDPKYTMAIEPCSNFAQITRDMGYLTLDEFWNKDVSQYGVVNRMGKMDVIYAANCFCHIEDIKEAFAGIATCLKDDGIFVFEDPSLLDVVRNISYDQAYDEHANIFSMLAVEKLLENVGMEIIDFQHLSVHGGSNRYYCAFNNKHQKLSSGIIQMYRLWELNNGLNEPLHKFATNVEFSKTALINLMDYIKFELKQKICVIGATSKFTVVSNYCNLGTKYFDVVMDTTPHKQGKFVPGTHIPIVAPVKDFEGYGYCFLGAWNFKDFIVNNEKNYIDRGGKFITHVSIPHTFPLSLK
jgi:methylation protein EvaC